MKANPDKFQAIAIELCNNFREFFDRPYASNFNKSELCGKQSKAFGRSIKIAAINLLSSRALLQSSIIFKSAVWQPKPGINAVCE
jgi:hypothetical protein